MLTYKPITVTKPRPADALKALLEDHFIHLRTMQMLSDPTPSGVKCLRPGVYVVNSLTP